MCGIAGFNWIDQTLAAKMTACLTHRGPDASGLFCADGVSLGHRRLSILDLSEKGAQPMQFGHLVIAYNGEIYNFQEIREELKSLGHQFHSNCDTEVILHAYHAWGADCVNKFNGMWAFCIYDKKNNCLFLSRDRFGIKPLYYFFDGNKFLFASELKALRTASLPSEINKEALNFYFYQKYIGGEHVIFKNFCKLKPGHNLIFDLQTRNISVTEYYNLKDQITRCNLIPLPNRLKSLEPLIADAVEKRLIADVPVGSFLSGGIDSSLISSIIAKNKKDFKTFSIGFKDESYDEIKYSKIVSEHIKTHHHYEYIGIDDELIKYVVGNMDEPFGDSSILPTYLLSKITREFVTVSLSGDAGDEVFGGYDSYKAWKLSKHLPLLAVSFLGGIVNLLPPSDKKLSFSFKARKFVQDYDSNVNRRHLNWMSTFNDNSRKELLGSNFIASESVLKCDGQASLLSLQLNDINNYLAEDILKKVDLASMLNSLEVRVPFLDYRIVPLVLSLPMKYKIRGLKTKWLLKQIAGKYIPAKIANRKKRGFTVPISRWISQSEFIRSVLSQHEFFEHNQISFEYVQELLKNHLERKEDNARKLWLVFVFNYWWHKNG
ncbi:MAG: asparagine synthase (glutamine-hydrolyzing) [Sedimentisphaerales bacterium]|nr:asparagine synthase (glutamine-hydrolyzing) [Sedimentisphaerales bacterium]